VYTRDIITIAKLPYEFIKTYSTVLQ